MEGAARRFVQRAGRLTGQDHSLTGMLLCIIGGRHCCQQGVAVGVACLAVQLLRIHDFHQFSQVHNANDIGDMLHHRQIMRNKQIGQVKLTLLFFKQIDNLCLD